MTAEGNRCGKVTAHGFPRDERGEEDRELRLACARELVGSGVEDEVREWLAERGFGVVDHAPRGMVAPGRPHPGLLLSLPWEHDRNAHRLCAALRHRVSFPTWGARAWLHNPEHLPASNPSIALPLGNDAHGRAVRCADGA